MGQRKGRPPKRHHPRRWRAFGGPWRLQTGFQRRGGDSIHAPSAIPGRSSICDPGRREARTSGATVLPGRPRPIRVAWHPFQHNFSTVRGPPDAVPRGHPRRMAGPPRPRRHLGPDGGCPMTNYLDPPLVPRQGRTLNVPGRLPDQHRAPGPEEPRRPGGPPPPLRRRAPRRPGPLDDPRQPRLGRVPRPQGAGRRRGTYRVADARPGHRRGSRPHLPPQPRLLHLRGRPGLRHAPDRRQ